MFGVVPLQALPLVKFASLVAPIIVLSGLMFLLYWGLGALVLPCLLHSPLSPRRRLAIAFPFVSALSLATLGYMRQPSGYWTIAVLILFVTGVVEGAIIARLVRKVLHYLTYIPGIGSDKSSDKTDSTATPQQNAPDRASDGGQMGQPKGNAQQPSDSGSRAKIESKLTRDKIRKGSRKLFRKVLERLYKLFYKFQFNIYGTLITVVATGIVFAVSYSRFGVAIRTADYTLTTFATIVGVKRLTWKLTMLRVQEDEESVVIEALPIVGLLIMMAGAVVFRLPDFFIPGTEPLQQALAPLVIYDQRVMDMLFTLPIYSMGALIVQQIGIGIGIIIAAIAIRHNQTTPAR